MSGRGAIFYKLKDTIYRSCIIRKMSTTIQARRNLCDLDALLQECIKYGSTHCRISFQVFFCSAYHFARETSTNHAAIFCNTAKIPCLRLETGDHCLTMRLQESISQQNLIDVPVAIVDAGQTGCRKPFGKRSPQCCDFVGGNIVDQLPSAVLEVGQRDVDILG